MEKSFENKENISKIVVEIGPGRENYIQQYKKEIPSNTIYKTIDIDYAFLPHTKDQNKRVIPLEDESVNEIVLSNVLSDMANTHSISPRDENEFTKEILNSHPGVFKDSEEKWNYVQSEIAYYQKFLTISDAIRVLKKNGSLVIYENYRQFHPDAVRKIFKWLQNNSELDFIEDLEEEARIQPIFDQEKQGIIDRSKKLNPNSKESDMYFPRKFNKVYKIRKK